MIPKCTATNGEGRGFATVITVITTGASVYVLSLKNCSKCVFVFVVQRTAFS